jgi:hypothetical protein
VFRTGYIRGAQNPRQLFTQVTKFCTVAPNIVIIIVVAFSCMYKNMYQFPCTKHKVSDDRLIAHSRIVGSQYGTYFYVTLLVPNICMWHTHFLENMSTPGSDTVYITVHNNYSNNYMTIKTQFLKYMILLLHVLVYISHLQGGG